MAGKDVRGRKSRINDILNMAKGGRLPNPDPLSALEVIHILGCIFAQICDGISLSLSLSFSLSLSLSHS